MTSPAGAQPPPLPARPVPPPAGMPGRSDIPVGPVTALATPTAPPPVGMMVNYSPVAMAKRAAGFRSLLIRRTIGLVISVVIALVWWFLLTPQIGSLLFWLLVGSITYSLVQVVLRFVQLKRARRTTARIPLGPAFQIDCRGVVISSVPEGERVDWGVISKVTGRNKVLNPGPVLEFTWGDGRVWSVPIIVLDAAPAAIDSALRAFSLGRFGLDLSSVDEIW